MEWYDLATNSLISRLCVVAPRDHAKTECLAVNLTVWKMIYFPGYWAFIFSNTGPQAEKVLERIVDVLIEVTPDVITRPRTWHKGEIWLRNRSRVTVRGSGAAVRGVHPDLIIGDDILDLDNSATHYQREKIKKWWFGTVTNMSKPGTKIVLIGTPQHRMDLLMSLKDNPLYEWRIYPAEYETGEKP